MNDRPPQKGPYGMMSPISPFLWRLTDLLFIVEPSCACVCDRHLSTSSAVSLAGLSVCSVPCVLCPVSCVLCLVPCVLFPSLSLSPFSLSLSLSLSLSCCLLMLVLFLFVFFIVYLSSNLSSCCSPGQHQKTLSRGVTGSPISVPQALATALAGCCPDPGDTGAQDAGMGARGCIKAHLCSHCQGLHSYSHGGQSATP